MKAAVALLLVVALVGVPKSTSAAEHVFVDRGLVCARDIDPTYPSLRGPVNCWHSWLADYSPTMILESLGIKSPGRRLTDEGERNKHGDKH